MAADDEIRNDEILNYPFSTFLVIRKGYTNNKYCSTLTRDKGLRFARNKSSLSENSCCTVGGQCWVVVIREGYRIARDWRYTAPYLASIPRCLVRVRVCAIHPFYYMGSMGVSAFYQCFLALALYSYISLILVAFMRCSVIRPRWSFVL